MAISTQTFTQFVSNAVAAIQGAASALADLTVGSILLAVVQAVSGIALWLQGIAVQVAGLTRFATSFGTDADSFGADFGFSRLPAEFATGQVTFSRFTPTNQATIQAATNIGTDANGNIIYVGGTLVQTADATQQYQVIPDTMQPTYNATLNTYIIPAGTASATATVKSTNAAAAANVIAGAISVVSQAIAFVDTVSNAAPMENGADAESDTAYKARFPLYLVSLARATAGAVNYAITSQGEGVNNTLTENLNYVGQTDPGYFYAVVDNGSGSPPSGFLSTVSNAIDAVRPLCSSYAVFAPVIVSAGVSLALTAAPGYVKATVAAALTTALQKYIDTLPIGTTFNYSRIASIAYSVPGVGNVGSVTLNGGTADLVATGQQIVKAGAITIS